MSYTSKKIAFWFALMPGLLGSNPSSNIYVLNALGLLLGKLSEPPFLHLQVGMVTNIFIIACGLS